MAAKEYTTAQITALLIELQKRLLRQEKIIRNLIVDDDSGTFGSNATSLTGNKGSNSASWSAERLRSFDISNVQTSGTGSNSLSIAEVEGLPGA